MENWQLQNIKEALWCYPRRQSTSLHYQVTQTRQKLRFCGCKAELVTLLLCKVIELHFYSFCDYYITMLTCSEHYFLIHSNSCL